MYGLKAVPFSGLQPGLLQKESDFHAQLGFPTSPDKKRREIWGTPGAPPVFRTKGSLIKIAIWTSLVEPSPGWSAQHGILFGGSKMIRPRRGG